MRFHIRLKQLSVTACILLVGTALCVGMAARVTAQAEGSDSGPSLFLPLINSTLPPGKEAEYAYMIIEEDIQVPLNFFELRASDTEAAYRTNLWTNGIVPFEFDANVTAANQTAMLGAIALWEAAATVDFQQCASNSCTGDHVHIQNATVNNSPVGRMGGEQIINIVDWGNCFIMAHELAHSLGFWHEQMRADRNAFVQINFGNIIDAQEGNFAIRTDGGEYGFYDFDSVMHYGRCAFNVNMAGCQAGTTGASITVLPPNQATPIGQRTHLSTWDRLTMSFLYPEPNWRFVNISYSGAQSGTFLQPYQQFTTGVANTPSRGTLWMEGGTYAGVGTYDKPMTIRAPFRNVTIGP